MSNSVVAITKEYSISSKSFKESKNILYFNEALAFALRDSRSSSSYGELENLSRKISDVLDIIGMIADKVLSDDQKLDLLRSISSLSVKWEILEE